MLSKTQIKNVSRKGNYAKAFDPISVIEWAKAYKIRVLNVAGPRESKTPGIHDKAVQFLRKIFE